VYDSRYGCDLGIRPSKAKTCLDPREYVSIYASRIVIADNSEVCISESEGCIIASQFIKERVGISGSTCIDFILI
jgi:hypothetical protein